MEYKKFSKLNNDIINIWTSVFIEEQDFQKEFDDIDEYSSHIVLYENKKPIATCRYFTENDIYHIGRVAILKEYRSKHLGNTIMQIAEKEIKKEGGKKIEVSAQLRVSKFYHKLGFIPVGDTYLDEYCQHIKMIKKL